MSAIKLSNNIITIKLRDVKYWKRVIDYSIDRMTNAGEQKHIKRWLYRIDYALWALNSEIEMGA